MNAPIIWLTIGCWLALVSHVRGDTVWITGADHPQFGWLVRESESQIEFRVFGSDSSTPLEIPRTQIELLIVNVDTARLEKLGPENWADYRNFAEELAVQKQDPAARELAVRLYLIAANAAAGDLQESCLNGLISLAENEQQRAQCQLLRQMVLAVDQPVVASAADRRTDLQPDGSQLALQIVRLIRRGRGTEASELLGQPATSTHLQTWTHICSIADLNRLAALDRLSADQLHWLLKIELALLRDETSLQSRAENWATFAQQSASTVTGIPSFTNITPFDPAASVYRGGAWVRPE